MAANIQLTTVDVLVVGGGLGGIAALNALRNKGLGVVVVEAGSGAGGTWFWNRYPGARCDVDSLQYSLGFAPHLSDEWTWSEKFATQAEILRYIEYVIEREDMGRHFRFNTRVDSAIFDADASCWTVTTASGEMIRARFCVMASGTLSATNIPDLPGLDAFRGERYHTGSWPHDGVELRGKRIGVIGTGSSGVQFIPDAAKQADHVTVFQRNAPYVVPARNRPLSDAEISETRRNYPELRRQWRRSPNAIGMNFGTKSAMEVNDEDRRRTFEAAWAFGGGDFGACFNDLSRNMDSNAEVMAYMRWKIGEIVDNPETAALLTPTFLWGSRRICIGTDYYETYNRPNVSLVDIRNRPIEGFTAGGVLVDGVEHAIDMLVLATGFDAVTGTLLRLDIRGRDGKTLRDAWSKGPRTYLGMTVSGFPNMFMVSGPQSPGTLINVAVGSEMHAEWIADCIAWLDTHGIAMIDATPEAQDAWVDHTNTIASKSLMSKSESWWTGANIPGKPRGYLGYVDWLGYNDRCAEVAADGYAGFAL